MLYTDVSIIVEIARHPNGKDYPRWDAARRALRHASISGYSVVSVAIEQSEEPVVVPGFGHDVRCKDDVHVCDVQPWNVNRYFGWHVTVAGKPEYIFDTYQLTDYARITVCGISQPQYQGTEQLRAALKLAKGEA